MLEALCEESQVLQKKRMRQAHHGKMQRNLSILKPKRANSLIGALNTLFKTPEIVVSGFCKAGILDKLQSD